MLKSVLLLAIIPLLPAVPQLARAQGPRRLTLEEAEQSALHNHPRIASAGLTAEAARVAVTEARAPLAPQIGANFTSVGADHNTTLSAGTIQTSSLYSRAAAGMTISQLIADFGRTSNLIEAAALRASSQQEAVRDMQASVLMQVDRAYYQTLAADTVLQVARAVVENRRLTLRQVEALAHSSLKSTLDVSFAEVAVSDAELALFRAENDATAARAHLAAAMGETAPSHYELADEQAVPPIETTVEDAVSAALRNRPDLASLALSRDAAGRTALAEKALSRPSLSLLGVAGGLPATDPRLRDNYSAVGLNVNIPVWNGKLFAARQAEADLRARAVQKDVEALALRVSEQVRVAWLEANTAYRRLDVTARLVAQAEKTLRLAQIRYDNGLGSMVELNQAQLSQVSAEIEAAGAKYDYLSRRAELRYAMGAMR
jgi:outer membrane protein